MTAPMPAAAADTRQFRLPGLRRFRPPRGSAAVTVFLLALPTLLFVGFLFIAPVAAVLGISVTDPTPGLQNYAALADSKAIRSVLAKTFQISIVTTLLACAFGYVIAFSMLHVGGRARAVLFACVLVPLWSSVLIRAFAWVTLLRSNGLLNQALMDIGLTDTPLALVRNDLGVLIGMVHVMIPMATLPIYSVMREIDPKLIRAARTLGASEGRALWHVFVPLSLPGVAAAAVLVFVNALGFFITPSVLGGGKTVMIAEYIELQISTTLRWGLGTMLATVLLAAVGCIFAIGMRLPAFRRQYRI